MIIPFHSRGLRALLRLKEMRLLKCTSLLLAVSCAPQHKQAVSASSSPYALLDNNFVTDLTLNRAPELTDLKSLLLTLPVFEVAPQDRRGFIDREGVITNNTLRVPGHGAQSTLVFKRLSTPDHYELTIEGLEDANDWVYIMKRSGTTGYGYNGWEILDRKPT